MNHKPMLLSVAVISIAASSAWSQPAQSPVVRLRKAVLVLQSQASMAEKTLQGLDAKIKKAKQTAPSAARSLDWIGSAISGKKVLRRLQETKASLLAAQKGLSKFDGGCQGLTAAGWEPVIAADQQLAQAVQGFKKIKTDLVQLHNAKLWESALNPIIKQLGGKSPDQAQALQALLKVGQDSLAGSAASLQKGLEAKDLAGAGGLLKAHNAYCKAQSQKLLNSASKAGDQRKTQQSTEPRQPVVVANPIRSMVKNLIKTTTGGGKSIPKTPPVPLDARELLKALRTGPTGGMAEPATGTALFLYIFGESITNIVLAGLGDREAYAREVGRSLYERIPGSLENAYTHQNNGDLGINELNEVVDKNNVVLGTIDKDGRVVPSAEALKGYKPWIDWLGP